ncbi:MAG: general secretion pathway protein GspB [Candidatus Omnitrophica bacterium]|jgi:hypothetical protein|nr:general secretion pathway protein GspB [Candidatus Omnitrophota bacterium]
MLKSNNIKIIFTIVLSAFSFQLSAFSCFAQEGFKYDSKGKRNPFIPLVTSDGKLLKLETEETANVEGLLLEGIIYDKNGSSFAIVNSNVVKVGDMIGDIQVLKIGKEKVIFIKDGQTLEIELRKEEE